MNRWRSPSPATLVIVAALAPAVIGVGLVLMAVEQAVVIRVVALSAVVVALLGGALARSAERRAATTFKDAGQEIGLDGSGADAGAIAQGLTREMHALRAALADAGDRIDERSAIIDALDDPILAFSAAGRVVAANAEAGRFLGVDRERLIGLTSEEAVAQAPILAALRGALEGRPSRERLDLATRAGSRIYDVSAGPVLLARQEPGAVILLRDVTDLARAVRMKADFVANASHELRTPLAAIRAALDTALSADDDPALLRRFVGMAPDHLHRLEELTRDLIDLSRLENPESVRCAEPLDLCAIQESLRALYDDAARRRDVALEFDLAPALTGFRTDPRLLHLILKNLLDNALKFCRAGSVVRLVAILTDTQRHRRCARFEMRDEGVGIPLNQQQRVFERFFQVDAARAGAPQRGTGLGLSIVKHAAGALGGEVGIDSVYGEGTTVWLVIPEMDAVGAG